MIQIIARGRRLHRRRLLIGTLLLGLATQARVALAAAGAGSPAAAAATGTCLAALLDTLIPRDQSPGATDAGVHRVLLAKAARRAGYRGLLRAGCGWLDAQAPREGAAGFAALDAAARGRVVERAAAAAQGSLERRFFERVRDDAMFVYYAQPASWSSLGYRGPPQPVGFPDHAQPPQR